MKPTAWNQRDALRDAFLLAGVPDDGEERVFVAEEIGITDHGIVAFCRTRGHVRVHGGAPVQTADAAAYADRIFSELHLPDFRHQPGFNGFCALVGTVRLVRPPGMGKPTLEIRLEQFVPEAGAERAYQARILSAPGEIPAESGETNIPFVDVPLDDLRLATAGA